MLKTAHLVQVLLLALWLGAIVEFAFVTAPGIFRSAGSRKLAGDIVGTLLRRFYPIESALAVGSVVTSEVLLWAGPRTPLRAAAALLSLVLFALHAVNTRLLTPKLFALRPEIRTFEREYDPAADPARARFDRLHKASERIMGLELLLVLAALGVTVISR